MTGALITAGCVVLLALAGAIWRLGTQIGAMQRALQNLPDQIKLVALEVVADHQKDCLAYREFVGE